MITVDSQRRQESTASNARTAPRTHAQSARLGKTLMRRWMRQGRDKIRLWRDEYLVDAFAIIFTLGIVVASCYFGMMLGAGR